MPTYARMVGLPRLVAAACLVALATCGAAADQIAQRYTLTDLGTYPDPYAIRSGSFNGTLDRSPRIDNAGQVTYGNAPPTDYWSLSGTVPYQGPAPLDPTSPGGVSQPTHAWITATAGQYSVGGYTANGSATIPFIFDGTMAR